jgi:small-conductance mechanosensitive channel
MIDDSSPSLEFDRFEDMRRTLADVLIAEGHDLIEAEKIALYVVQGMREVPKLASLLAEENLEKREEVLYLLRRVLDNAQAFDRARSLLGGTEDEGT